MEDIRKVFTIQWVGPFDTFTSLSEYLNDPNTCDCHLFSFYYCSGNKKGKGHPISKDDYRYFGKCPNRLGWTAMEEAGGLLY